MELNIKLGFHKGYWPTYVFIGGDDENMTWYTLDENTKIPIQYPALTGFITDLRVVKKEYKGKLNLKLDIKMHCGDDVYKIRSGNTTTFSKGIISSLYHIAKTDASMLKEPLTLMVSKGDDGKVVFGNIWDPSDKTPIRSEYLTDNLFPAIQAIQKELGVPVQTVEELK